MATPVLLQQLTLLLLLFSLLLRINSYITKPIGSRTRLSNIKSLFSSKELNDHRELIDDESKFRSALQVNGSLLSLEVYAGQKDSIDLVISQISNWARLESNCIQEFGYQSVRNWMLHIYSD